MKSGVCVNVSVRRTTLAFITETQRHRGVLPHSRVTAVPGRGVR